MLQFIAAELRELIIKNNKIEIIESEGSLDVSLVGRKNGVPGQITNHRLESISS